ncbi:MAG: hypothetical protein R3B53_00285 [Candidatus Paceibacterota bacterium]
MDNQPKFEGEEMKMPEQMPTESEVDTAVTEHKGLTIIMLLVALVVILIGLVYWYQAMNREVPMQEVPMRPTYETNNEPESTTAEAQVDSFGVMSTSDELGTIEADLESTNLDSLEAEMIQIEEELQAEY